eukprot:scaffold13336_cov201-Alexandrium_tamarense.AAC.9
MSLPPRQHNEQQQAFLRQANILRKNLNAWDTTLRSSRGEDWPSMLGRLNAAYDVSFFLSTRLVTAAGGDNSANNGVKGGKVKDSMEDGGALTSHSFGDEEPAKRLRRYETQAAELASKFEEESAMLLDNIASRLKPVGTDTNQSP